MSTLIKIDRNGTKYYEGAIECDRCNGKGIYFIGVCNGRLVPSWVDQGICFKCGGAGKVQGKWKEYTPEYAEKLEARRRAKAEAQAKAYAEEEARREAERKAKEEAERIAREQEEAQERARKAISQHVGQIGDIRIGQCQLTDGEVGSVGTGVVADTGDHHGVVAYCGGLAAAVAVGIQIADGVVRAFHGIAVQDILDRQCGSLCLTVVDQSFITKGDIQATGLMTSVAWAVLPA